MTASGDLASTSLMVSMIVGGVAIALGLIQWSGSRNRDADLTEADARDFVRQDWRRGVGVVLMLLLALGIYVGSRIPPLIDTEFPYDLEVRQSVRALSGAWVETWVGGHANPLFLAIWLAVIILLVVLLALAFFDWLATRRYAHRQRSSMARERLEILRETFRRRDTLRNGNPPEPGKNGA